MFSDAIVCPPDVDTTAFQNPELFFENIKNNILKSVRVSIPCKIVEYDRTTHIATVQVMYNYRMVNDEIIAGPKIKNIELLRQMAGGFLIDFPISAGDTGWLIAVDRDCGSVKESRSQEEPRSSDVNSYKTGFWIPDQWGKASDVGVSGVDDSRLVIQSADGSQKISIGTGDVHITATTLYITGNVNISGNVTTEGDYSIDGSVTSTGTVKESGTNISLGTHTHTTIALGSQTSSPTAGT